MEAAELFTHCPVCGAAGLTCSEERRFACPSCGQVFFHNTATGVGALIEDGRGSVLVIRRRHDPGAGLYDLPGGFVDVREGAEQALHREVQEELGLTVTDLRYLCSAPNHYAYHGLHYHVCDIFYTCHTDDLSAAVARDDAASYPNLAPFLTP